MQLNIYEETVALGFLGRCYIVYEPSKLIVSWEGVTLCMNQASGTTTYSSPLWNGSLYVQVQTNISSNGIERNICFACVLL